MSILYRPRLGCRPLIALALAPLFYASSAWADYPVQAGDVVEVSIGGMIEVHQRSAVQLDGTVTFPRWARFPSPVCQPPKSERKSRRRCLARQYANALQKAG